MKPLLRVFVEQGLQAPGPGGEGMVRFAANLPLIDADLPLRPAQLSNAGLFAMLEED